METMAEVMANECVFTGQRATDGGAISAIGDFRTELGATTAWIRGSNFTMNTARKSGGAIYIRGATLFLTNNKFLSNSVSGDDGAGGGAFFVEPLHVPILGMVRALISTHAHAFLTRSNVCAR